MKVLKMSLASLVLVAFSFALGPAVAAATNFDLFGDAMLFSPGNNSNTAAQLRSNVAPGQTSGGVDFAIPAGMILNQLTNLSTDYMFTQASCGGGSPRFQINVSTASGTKNIFVYLATALGLDLITPASFLKAISEGAEPTAADKTTIDRQIAGKKIRVWIFNSQNSTPDVQRFTDKARKVGIHVATITETLVPASASFQQWQVGQLRALAAALAKATGR